MESWSGQLHINTPPNMIAPVNASQSYVFDTDCLSSSGVSACPQVDIETHGTYDVGHANPFACKYSVHLLFR
jgi:hypothetical protein